MKFTNDCRENITDNTVAKRKITNSPGQNTTHKSKDKAARTE
jgi:hypothetical protein